MCLVPVLRVTSNEPAQADRRSAAASAAFPLRAVSDRASTVDPVTAEKFGPIEPWFEPLLLSIGRAVLGAAALEKVLLVDIARRRVEHEGLAAALADELTRLERQTAGELARKLRRLGLDDDVAARVDAVVQARNWLVHRFVEDADVIVALGTDQADQIVERVDAVALECQALIDTIGPAAFGGLETSLGAALPQLVAILRSVDPETLPDGRLRAQLKVIQATDPAELEALWVDGDGAPSPRT